jgi:hypothetical protein
VEEHLTSDDPSGMRSTLPVPKATKKAIAEKAG